VIDVPSVLVVTNDFPPRVGGVQQYVWNLVANLPAPKVEVLAPTFAGAMKHDRELPFAVHRWPAPVLWPTHDLAVRVRSLARRQGADVVLFGHGFPAALLGPGLRRRGLPYVAMTHGAEVWQACLPGVAEAMRRSLDLAHAVTAVSSFTGRAIRGSLGLRRPLVPLAPGVDERRFSLEVDGSGVRQRHGLRDRPLVVSVSRLVPRKGHDMLIRAMPDVGRLVPDAALLIVGGGPYRPGLERLAGRDGAGSVAFAGEVAAEDLPAHYAAGDVFAMPCRSRFGGLEVEGFGIVYLEAAATGRPAVAGRSGGADEAVIDEETGLVVEGGEPKAIALAIVSLLDDPGRASRYGAAGRRRVEADHTWTKRTERLARVLAEAAGDEVASGRDGGSGDGGGEARSA
jgi:phosphatidylinositol alpha-1,6-mannosyltransferase